MDILIVAQYLRDIECFDGNNSRFIYIAKMLAKSSTNNVEIITSDFIHVRKAKCNKIDKIDGIKFTLCHEKGYTKNVCLKRFISHKELAINIKKYLKNRKKPDVIYAAVPSLSVAKVCAKFCEKNNIKFIIDVQDLWPEAFKMVFNIPVISNLIFYPMKKQADYIYSKADKIIAVSETYCNRALKVNKKTKKGSSVFLGTDLRKFDKNCSNEIVTNNKYDKDCISIQNNLVIVKNKNFKLYKKEDEIWIAYCGTLGSSYDLNNAMTAISKIKSHKVRFVIMGDGPLYNKFITKAKDLKIKAIFTGRIDYNIMCSILKKCDIAINPIMHGAAQSIINKHADYVAAGLPIVSTQENKEFCDLINNYNMGINCNNKDIIELKTAIEKLINNKDLRIKMGKNARRCAVEKFDREITYKELVNIIQQGRGEENEGI